MHIWEFDANSPRGILTPVNPARNLKKGVDMHIDGISMEFRIEWHIVVMYGMKFHGKQYV